MTFKRFISTLLMVSAVSLSSLCSAASYGDRGDDVKEIQEYLIAQNLLHVEADGVYGSATVNAIKDFQSALGLEVDGVCGAMTYKLLRAAAYDKIDVTTWKPGDYVPDVPTNSASSVISTVKVVGEVAQNAGVGDIIKLGTMGEGVVYLQNRLIELGFYSGEVDGVCSTSTVNALKDFQHSRGIKADGVCGRGTYSALDETLIDLNGDEDEYSFEMPDFTRVIRVEATAYSSAEPNLSKYTSTGTLCRRGVIAVDPGIIPLGTKVFIPGYGYAVAEDTGGAIYGHKIDVAFDTVAECYEFGRKFVDVYIID